MTQRSLLPEFVPHGLRPSGRIEMKNDAAAWIARAFPGASAEHREEVTTEPIRVRATKGVGGCEEPVQLSGQQRRSLIDTGTGEITRSNEHVDTYASCKTRRATRCEPCATLYQHDARHLIGSGLVGGKGTSEEVASSPALFITLTAPSFGVVHGVRGNGQRCHPRRDAGRCRHGRSLVCWSEHDNDDTRFGQPLCPDCYDYSGAALWNNAAPALWRITRINIDRGLARHLGVSVREAKKLIRSEYVKVAEFQKRGLVHFHVTMRFDVAPVVTDTFTIEVLQELVTDVARQASTEGADGDRISWGEQLDVDPLPQHTSEDQEDDTQRRPATRRQVTNYLAKYSTKGSDVEGKLDRRFKNDEELKFLGVNAHLATMVRTAWKLARKYPETNLDRWSHQLGYRGHFLTKSCCWSTTFKALRQARIDHQEQLREASWAALNPEVRQQIETQWSFVGVGYRSGADAAMAEHVRDSTREQRRSPRAA